MEQNINIAEILKDKQKGIKMYSPLFGEVELSQVANNEILVAAISDHAEKTFPSFSKNGKYWSNFAKSECLLFPSSKMRDWNKFAWKKGDVLLDTGTCSVCIFDKWNNDEYTEFNAVFITPDYRSAVLKTECWHEMILETDIQRYISKIEKTFGGKLNRETLEIEKPGFKDGDIVVRNCGTIIIVKEIGFRGEVYYHAYLTNKHVSIQEEESFFYGCKVDIERFASDSEKQQLFDALAKEGKRWDAEKKRIENLPKKCEFQPFDKVLVKDLADGEWHIDFFECMHDSTIYPYRGISGLWGYCIPYEGNEHLLGTTDEWKGGENG